MILVTLVDEIEKYQVSPNFVHERKIESGMDPILLFLQFKIRNSVNSPISDGKPPNKLSARFNTIRFLTAPMLGGSDVRLLQSRCSSSNWVRRPVVMRACK